MPNAPLNDPDQQTAYTALNNLRGTCGFGLLATNTNLQTAAFNHSLYISVNYNSHPDAYSHTENSAYSDYTGLSPLTRAQFAGYAASLVGEDLQGVLTTTPSTGNSTGFDELLLAPYHLRSLMFGMRDIGWGSDFTVLNSGPDAGQSIKWITIETGVSGTAQPQDVSSTDVVTYPCSGITTPAATFQGESPSAIPGRNYATNPTGQPIYLHVLAGQVLSVSTFTLTDAGGNVVAPAVILTSANDPNGILQENEAMFIPNVPLNATTSYTVSIIGTNQGVAFSRSFSFHTS